MKSLLYAKAKNNEASIQEHYNPRKPTPEIILLCYNAMVKNYIITISIEYSL